MLEGPANEKLDTVTRGSVIKASHGNCSVVSDDNLELAVLRFVEAPQQVMIDIGGIEVQECRVSTLEVAFQFWCDVDQHSTQESLLLQVLIYSLIITKIHFLEAGYRLHVG